AGLALKKPDYSFSLTAEACEATAKLSATIMDTAHFSDVLVTVSVSGKNLRNTVAQAVRLVPQVPDKPFSLEATVRGNPTRELKISPLTLTIGNKSAFVNTAVTVRGISADLSVEATGHVDIADAALMAPLGVKPMNADFDVWADKTKVLIKKMAVNANKSDIAVTGEAIMAAVPVVSAKIAAQYLDPSDFTVEKTPAAAQKTARQKQGGLFSADKIDLSALKLVNGELAASVQHLKIADDYVSAALQAQLKNGDLTVSSFGVRSALGTVTGSAHLNAAVTPAVMMVKAKSDELKLNELKAIQEHLKDSTVSFSAHLQAKGDSVKSFISTLNGRVEAEVSQGTIVNKWFNSLPVAMGVIKNKSNAMSFSESDQVSQLVCGALNLTVKNGVITSADQIAIETSAVNFAVSGDINLPMEQLSLTMVPSLPQGSDKTQSALALTQIVKISGPFSDLKPSLDTKKAAQTVVQAGLGTLVNKVAERQGIAVPASSSAQTSADLCEKALGRPLKEQKVQQPVVQTVPAAVVKTPHTEQALQKQTPKEQFKKQLLNSLSEALKK
ncbi:MAG: AsmA-like C-terminal region-containing protein, partial [Alphaproteobacteria bacterium]